LADISDSGRGGESEPINPEWRRLEQEEEWRHEPDKARDRSPVGLVPPRAGLCLATDRASRGGKSRKPRVGWLSKRRTNGARYFRNRFHHNSGARPSCPLRVSRSHAPLFADRAYGCLATTQCQCVSAFRGAGAVSARANSEPRSTTPFQSNTQPPQRQQSFGGGDLLFGTGYKGPIGAATFILGPTIRGVVVVPSTMESLGAYLFAGAFRCLASASVGALGLGSRQGKM
jgi:hypothetical protein